MVVKELGGCNYGWSKDRKGGGYVVEKLEGFNYVGFGVFFILRVVGRYGLL